MEDRFNFRVWDKEQNCYKYGLTVVDYMRGMVNRERYILEQCTGLKDKNGKLVYEGDIVDIWVVINIQGEIDRRRGKIYWNKEDLCFLIYVALDEEYYLYGQDICIIGNIHENGDLLNDR